jgi:sodium-dependent phosphate cotransporter
MLLTALVLLFLALFFLVKMLRSLMAQRTEIVFYNVLGKGGIRCMLLGAVITAIIQSSSVTTSILVPLLAAGIITIEMAFPVTLGADLGTTITALLASLAGGIEGTIVAFAHVAFNVTGVIMIYPIKRIRAIPISLAKWIGEKGAQHRLYAILYIVIIFFLIPGALIFTATLCK